MKKGLLVISSLAVTLLTAAQSLQQLESKRVHLTNGWSLTPVGKSLPLGDLPLNIAVSASKRLIAVTNNGQSTHSLQLIDTKNDKILDNIIILCLR